MRSSILDARGSEILVEFTYHIRDSNRTGMIVADNPQQVLDHLFPGGKVRLDNDTHVDYVHWVKHFHYRFVEWGSGKVLGDMSGRRPLNRRGR